MSLRKNRFIVLAALILPAAVLLLAPSAFARDAATARKFINDAKEAAQSQHFDDVERKLALAEASMDDCTPAEKDALAKEIAETREAGRKRQMELRRRPFMGDLDKAMFEANRQLGDRERFAEWEKNATELLDSEEGRMFLTAPELAGKKKELAALKKVSDQQADAKAIAKTKEELAVADKEMPELLRQIQAVDPKINKDVPIRRGTEILEELQKVSADLPASPAGAELKARCQKHSDAFAAASSTGEAADYVDYLSKWWSNDGESIAGWESETEVPTLEKLMKSGGPDADAFFAPKTTEMIRRANQWLERVAADDKYKRLKDDPGVKRVVDRIRDDRDKGLAKMEKVSDSLVSAIEAKKDWEKTELFTLKQLAEYRLKNNIDGSSKLQTMQSRVTAVVAGTEKRFEDASAAKDALAKKLSDAANAAWPAIAKAIKADEISDPDSLTKGQTIRITNWQNRMGWDYGGGSSGYEYGVTVNGRPVVGFYAPHVRSAVKATVEKLEWINFNLDERVDVIAVVEGKGQVEKRIRGEVRDAGGSTIGRTERWEPVDCIVVKVIAMRAGPVAVGPDGAVSESGAVVPVETLAASVAGGAGGASVSGSSGWVARIVWTLIGLAAAAALVMKTRPEMASQLAAAQGAGAANAVSAVGRNLDFIGLGVAALGIVWLLMSLVYRDLLPAAALTVCGTALAADFLKARGLLPEPQHAMLKKHSLTIALGTAAAIVLHLLMGGIPMV